MRMSAQEHYYLDTFPFGDAMKDWVENEVRMQLIVRTIATLANSLRCEFSLLLLHLWVNFQ